MLKVTTTKKKALNTELSVKKTHIYSFRRQGTGKKRWDIWKCHDVQAELLPKITDKTEQLIRQENSDNNSTNGTFGLLSDLAESVQEGFEELIDADSNKKKFIKALSEILPLLLNTTVNSIKNIKRIIKIATETTLKIWQGPRRQ